MKNLGLVGEAGRPVVIITASGAVYEGRPSIFTIYEQALSCETKMEIIVITGRQKVSPTLVKQSNKPRETTTLTLSYFILSLGPAGST